MDEAVAVEHVSACYPVIYLVAVGTVAVMKSLATVSHTLAATGIIETTRKLQ